MAEIISFQKPKKKIKLKKKSEPSPKIIAAIEKYFNDNEFKFKPIDEHGNFRTGFSLDCKLKDVSVAITAESNGVIIRFILPIGAGRDNEDQTRVAEFLTRANYGLRSGCFELDLSDGEIFFRDSLFIGENGVTSQKAIGRLISYGIAMLEIYGDALLKVICDVATPKEAVNEAEKH